MSSWIRTNSVTPELVTVQLNRPDRRNALSIALMESLCETLDRLVAQSDARVVILHGAGTVFCAGLDLHEASDPTQVERSADSVRRTLSMLREIPLISIAAVHGGAYAGGAGLMAACDLAIGSQDVKIGFPEARRGLLPALICDVLMSKVREGDLRELFLVGSIVDATRALLIGLLQQVVASDQLMARAEAVARDVLAGGPQTVRDTKQMLNQAYDRVRSADGQSAVTLHTRARMSAEATEGLAAFLEKREPAWVRRPAQ